MRITINITTGEYKGETFWQAAVEHRAHERAGRFSQSRDFTSEGGAKFWCVDQVEEILTNVAFPDSISNAPAHEQPYGVTPQPGRTVYPGGIRDNVCRCCSTDMGGSDHCPQCGCEEYEETCPDNSLYTYMVRFHDGEEFGMTFQAEDAEHAREQAEDAEPNVRIVSIERQS